MSFVRISPASWVPYGAALLARDRGWRRGHLNLLSSQPRFDNLQVKHTNVHCGRCSNNCLLTVNSFGNGRSLHHGQPLREGSGKPAKEQSKAPEPLCSTDPVAL